MNFGFPFNRHNDSTMEARNWQEKANKSIKKVKSFREMRLPSDIQCNSLSTKGFHLRFILKWLIRCLFVPVS